MTPAELKHVLNVAEQLLDADHFAFAQKGGNAIKALVAENQRLETVVEALKFYADPETYCAIGFFPDPPCGEFINDISDVGLPGLEDWKPGKRARAALAAIDQSTEPKA